MASDKRDTALQLVTFGQAKVLKAAGFDWEADYCFRSYNEGLGLLNEEKFQANWNDGEMYVSVPYVALALKWCRDVKGIEAFVKTEPNGREPPVNLSYLAILGGRLVSNYCRYYDEAESALLDAVLAEISEGGAK